MTIMAKRTHAKKKLLHTSLGVLACWLAACSTTVQGGTQTLADAGVEPSVGPTPDTDAALDGDVTIVEENDAGVPLDASKGPPPDNVSGACAQIAERWQEIAVANCVACHGENSPRRAGFSYVLDAAELIASGKVKPGDPDGSPLYLKLSSGQMPPANRAQRPSATDIEAVRTWITCGAPASEAARCEANCTTFLDIDARLDLMLQDTQSLVTPEERADVRYFDLSNYANVGHGASSLELYRGGLSYLVNSLSTGPKVVVPQPIDSQGLLFRIRLSDYGWSAATWQRIVTDYPYGVLYDPNSRAFPHNEADAALLRTRTGTAVPYVQADWFLSHAARTPLYYDILGMPGSLALLEDQLGVDIQANIEAQRAARAGFTDSGTSRFNRVIERHAISQERGALWLTYDFAAGAGSSNVITNPLDFISTSNEIFFNLPNGLQAYLITDEQGQRQNKAPAGAVQDPLSQDLAIEAGISCISCHTDSGIIPHDDEVRARTPLSTTDLEDLDNVLALYVEKAAMDMFVAEGRARYSKARAETRARTFVDGSVHKLNDAHLALLKLKDIAGVLGLKEAEMTALIDATPRIFPPEIATLRGPTQGLARDTFESVFANLVIALGLGQPAPRN